MSEPITMTERERAVFAHMARTLGNGTASHDIIVSNALLHFLDADFRASAESASRSCVPAEAEYTTAREQDRAEGFRAGIEAAARIEDRLAEHWERRPGDSKSTLTYGDLAEGARSRAAAIRALADKPAPDQSKGG